MIAAPVDPAARQTLKVLAAELDRKVEDLIREALRGHFLKQQQRAAGLLSLMGVSCQRCSGD